MTAPGRGGSPPPRGQAIPNSVRGAVLVGLAVIVGIIGLQILDDSGSGSSITAATSETSAPATTTPTGQASKPHPPGEVSIKVYNASDVQGAGQQLSDKLKTYGYNMLAPANLNGTRKGTVVQCRSGYDGDGAVIAGFGIGNGATAGPFPESPPDGADKANCIVIVGTA
jgi:LytR cell envelope-related transcriptional attenuator